MDIRQVGTTQQFLNEYLHLFGACFPLAATFSSEYLRWLYVLNPSGNVVGFDAWEGSTLAAHYVCIPVQAEINGMAKRLLLSLNTATHPDFQGKGLFTRLADATYTHAAENGFDGVYGVANANSTPGFVRKLGFELVSPLDAKIGIGGLGVTSKPETVGFRRLWDQASLSWRVSNPARPYKVVALENGEIGAWATTGKLGLVAWDEVQSDVPESAAAPRSSGGKTTPGTQACWCGSVRLVGGCTPTIPFKPIELDLQTSEGHERADRA